MYLLDTNVVSELRKIRSGKANPNVAHWADNVEVAALFVSAITIHELEIGILLASRKDASKATILREWMSRYVLPAFADRILPVDTAVALRSAALHVPQTRPLRDAFIAATALVHGMVVVTRNTADFQTTGVEIIDPWATSYAKER